MGRTGRRDARGQPGRFGRCRTRVPCGSQPFPCHIDLTGKISCLFKRELAWISGISATRPAREASGGKAAHFSDPGGGPDLLIWTGTRSAYNRTYDSLSPAEKMYAIVTARLRPGCRAFPIGLSGLLRRRESLGPGVFAETITGQRDIRFVPRLPLTGTPPRAEYRRVWSHLFLPGKTQ